VATGAAGVVGTGVAFGAGGGAAVATAGTTAVAGRAAGWPLPTTGTAAVSGLYPVRNSCQLGSTEEGSTRNFRYISSTSHSFWPNGELVLLTEPLASIPLPVVAI
jgi:hypothetical protein